MDKPTKLTIENLLARKEQAMQAKEKYKDIETKILGESCLLTIKKLPLHQFLTIMDNTQGETTMTDDFELNKELIYKTCPIFQSSRLQEEYECSEPYDIVNILFEDNIVEIGNVAAEIMGFYGVDTDTVKN